MTAEKLENKKPTKKTNKKKTSRTKYKNVHVLGYTF